MCGLAGIAGLSGSNDDLLEAGAALIPLLKHRGPDDSGVSVPGSGVVLVHTRLAILDLSPLGHQPMSTADGRYSIVFNGEIYNFRQLRTELESAGQVFRTGSDTEVLLALYATCGDRCVERLQGMFAFAVWDSAEQTLFLARDPLGIKPLYFWRAGATIAFASELRALLATKLGSVNLNPEAVFDFLRFGSVQEPSTLIAGVEVLGAGCCLTWRAGEYSVRSFWQLQFQTEEFSTQEAARLTRKALEESVARHFVSDVPVGIFLSGGIDSTALLALARSQGHNDLRTLCISFDDSRFNEGALADRTAKHFHTAHTDWRMTAEEGQSLVEGYLHAMDQPSNDGFNTYCVSRMAHQAGMKVVLSGLGGDELFCGYPSFQKIPRLLQLHRLAQMMPGSHTASRFYSRVAGGPRLRRFSEFLSSPGTVPDAWSAMRGFFTESEALILVRDWLGLQYAQESHSHNCWTGILRQPTIADQISACEISGYMQNQLLRDSDVMSMRWGLELRVPFVDRALVDAVSQISATQRLAPGKRMLLDAVPEIPPWIRTQPKRGFRFPFEEWVRDEWSETFTEVVASSPVPPENWYRTWCLYALQHFIKTNVTSPASNG